MSNRGQYLIAMLCGLQPLRQSARRRRILIRFALTEPRHDIVLQVIQMTRIARPQHLAAASHLQPQWKPEPRIDRPDVLREMDGQRCLMPAPWTSHGCRTARRRIPPATHRAVERSPALAAAATHRHGYGPNPLCVVERRADRVSARCANEASGALDAARDGLMATSRAADEGWLAEPVRLLGFEKAFR